MDMMRPADTVKLTLVDVSEDDAWGLVNHLSLNGYCFAFDEEESVLIVFIDELNYIETILKDRNIRWRVENE